MVPRRMTVTALGLLLAAVTLVVGGTIGAAVATPRTNSGWNSGRDHVEVDVTLGKDGLTAKGHTVVDVGSPGGKGASPRSGPTVPAPASLAGPGRTEPGLAEARAPAPTAPTAAAVAAPAGPPSTVVAVPAPALAPESATPLPPTAPVASVTPAAPAPDVAAASSSTPRSAPRAAVDAIVSHAPASLAAVALLLAAALLFLVVQPALDRHDKRLVLGGVDDAPARFR